LDSLQGLESNSPARKETTARVLVQFTTVLKGRGPLRLQRERDGKAAKERKTKGKERMAVK